MKTIIDYKSIVESKLKEYFEEYKANSSYSSKIWDAMEYTTLLPGKRLRAIMCLETARLLGLDINKILPPACSLEIMHAYSLIHDDLPCMDNDDLRRGKPTNHKVFGEAIAVLAGDALLSFGAQIIADKSEFNNDVTLNLIKEYISVSGALGIIAGQVADIEAENKKIDFENLKYIHKYKTGALFKCSFMFPILASASDKQTKDMLIEFAENFGIMFQVYDDIIDCTLTTEQLGKTAGKDAISNKMTYVSLFGLNEAKNIFTGLLNKNRDILSKLSIHSDIFEEILHSLDKKVYS